MIDRVVFAWLRTRFIAERVAARKRTILVCCDPFDLSTTYRRKP